MAGADTTAVFLRWFIACMVTYPDIQKRAQQEVDEVIGLDKSPVLDDIEKLPYLRAIIKEVWLIHKCNIAHKFNFEQCNRFIDFAL